MPGRYIDPHQVTTHRCACGARIHTDALTWARMGGRCEACSVAHRLQAFRRHDG